MSDQTSSSETPPSTPPNTAPSLLTKWGIITTYLDAANYWFAKGFMVLPILPGTKSPALKPGPWSEDLCPEKIQKHWSLYSDHEVACLVDDTLIVLDADTPQAEIALKELEDRFGLTPKFAVKTAKGLHDYFRRPVGTNARTNNHSTDKFPERLDVKSGTGYMILPPSTGKTIIVDEIMYIDELSEASQEFIDAIYQHNGRTAPSTLEEALPRPCIRGETDEALLKKLPSLLETIDPDCGYDEWVRVGMALYHETSGSDEGFILFDDWSKNGGKYPGIREIEKKWFSFRDDVANPVTIGTLVKMAKDTGADVSAIMNDDTFVHCEFKVITPVVGANPNTPISNTPLSRYSLQGRVDELEKQAVEQIPILGNIALLGQATAIYAKPNTGKTLITLFLIIEAIKQGKIDPAKLFYINMDDDHNGLIVKARLAEEYGFQMIADGHRGFEARAFREAVEKMVATDTAQGIIIILDTLKRFVDIMKKGKSANFTKFTRQFSMKGGTIIALAHTNKNPGLDGKPVYSGTTDIVDDFDCAYTMAVISEQTDINQKVVEFSNIKRRGNAAQSEAYSYAQESNISYYERLLSVQVVDPDQLVTTKHQAEVKSDAEVISAITSCIVNGFNTKMELALQAAEMAKISKRNAMKIVEKYTGDDPALHRWSFVVRARGAKVYELLECPTEQSPAPPMATP